MMTLYMSSFELNSLIIDLILTYMRDLSGFEVAIMKILLEQFKDDVTETKTGHKLLPPYIRVIQGDGV